MPGLLYCAGLYRYQFSTTDHNCIFMIWSCHVRLAAHVSYIAIRMRGGGTCMHVGAHGCVKGYTGRLMYSKVFVLHTPVQHTVTSHVEYSFSLSLSLFVLCLFIVYENIFIQCIYTHVNTHMYLSMYAYTINTLLRNIV